MQTFYLLIGKSNLYVYEKKDNTYERLYIEGNPEYAYDLNSAKTSIEQLMDELVNEYNLDKLILSWLTMKTELFQR